MSLPIEHNVPLASHTTLKVGGMAKAYVAVRTIDELIEAFEYARREHLKICVIGGGSNVIVPDNGLNALVIHPAFTEITLSEQEGRVSVRAGAGVVLDDLIAMLVKEGLWGLENFSGIPGSVGAVPIQNVGAYGLEAKDVVCEVEVFDARTHQLEKLSAEACAFGYRDSLFKQEKGKDFVVVSVTFMLTRTPSPRIAYKDLAQYFGGITLPSLSEIRDAVIRIRKGKFPDWHVVGTAGSFFKNPIIPVREFEALRQTYPDIPGFPHGDNIKVPLGWILDKVLGLRGYRKGNICLYEKQALVLVVDGAASASEVVSFGDAIIQKIFNATGISIEREVVVLE